MAKSYLCPATRRIEPADWRLGEQLAAAHKQTRELLAFFNRPASSATLRNDERR